MNPTPRPPRHRPQQGFMLLEVLAALLIFALGVMGLVGLQANAVKQVGDAKYRADAAMLAEDLVGQMQVANRSYAALNAAFNSTNGTAYTAWQTRVTETLPGAAAYDQTVTLTQVQPLPALQGTNSAGAVVTGTATGLTSSTQVTITLRWLPPGEPSANGSRQLTLVTQIK
ncbi:type IV pilus modification protein PilV [Roseateles sp.]|uniref:type IV pilus modification protein PilV n=1 Tax=Roseateles sp. TaxID=1971397 RepID=UPI0039E777E3